MLRAEYFREYLLQDQPCADARDHRREKASAFSANGPEYNQLKNDPQQRRADDRGRQRGYGSDVNASMTSKPI